MSTRLSIITTARGRLDIFPDICLQIWKQAHNPSEIEHIIMYDHDDWEMERFLSNYVKQPPSKILVDRFNVKHVPKINARAYGVIFNGEKNLHKDYWNIAAKVSKGEVVFGLCNDTKLLTSSYDKIILDSVESFKTKHGHDVCQILVDDDSSNHIDGNPINEFCSWVILTKSAANAIGGIVPDEIYASNGDLAVYNLFKSLPFESQINLRKHIKTEHISHYTGRRDIDKISTNMSINSNYLSEQEFESYRNKLINTYRSMVEK